MKCPMCCVDTATVKFKDIMICSECYNKIHTDIINTPVIHNDMVIGFVKSKVGNAIECILFENCVGFETKDGKCNAVVINNYE